MQQGGWALGDRLSDAFMGPEQVPLAHGPCFPCLCAVGLDWTACRVIWCCKKSTGRTFPDRVCVLLGSCGLVRLLTGLSWDIEGPGGLPGYQLRDPCSIPAVLGVGVHARVPCGRPVGRGGLHWVDALCGHGPPSQALPGHAFGISVWLLVANPCSGLQTFCSWVRDPGGAFAFMESFLFPPLHFGSNLR